MAVIGVSAVFSTGTAKAAYAPRGEQYAGAGKMIGLGVEIIGVEVVIGKRATGESIPAGIKTPAKIMNLNNEELCKDLRCRRTERRNRI
jgi:hypothetical protein